MNVKMMFFQVIVIFFILLGLAVVASKDVETSGKLKIHPVSVNTYLLQLVRCFLFWMSEKTSSGLLY